MTAVHQETHNCLESRLESKWALEALETLGKKMLQDKVPPMSEDIEGSVGQHRKNERMNRRSEKLGKWKTTIVLNVKRCMYESQ